MPSVDTLYILIALNEYAFSHPHKAASVHKSHEAPAEKTNVRYRSPQTVAHLIYLSPPAPPHSLRAGILRVPSPQTLPEHSSSGCYRFAFFAFPSAPASLPRLPATDAFSVLTRPAACSARSHASAASFVPSGAG